MRIVYCTDGSAGSVAAAELLGRLPLTEGDTLTLLRVAPLCDDGPGFEAERAALRATAAALQEEVLSGSPAEQIVQYAGSHAADLVVVGAMGAGGVLGFLMGSVAERVLRHAPCSVLVARPVTHGLRRGLVGVDVQHVSSKLVPRMLQFPLPQEMEVRLVTVLPPHEAIAAAAPAVWASLADRMENLLAGALEDAEECLRELARLVKEKNRPVSAEVLRGDPATSLIHAVEAEGADLAIIGSHGATGLDRFLLGSVSERVARHAPCSVLVVR